LATTFDFDSFNSFGLIQSLVQTESPKKKKPAEAGFLCCGGRTRTYDLWVMSGTTQYKML
jgi:hypothetical protein